MSLLRFLKNLFASQAARRGSDPATPKSSEDYAEEIETETERRRGMRGD